MTTQLSPSARKVQDALERVGLALEVVELPASTRTSAEAAQAVGCSVGQIAKSLVFRATQTETPVLVICSGANRVDEEILAARVGEPVTKANADFVREHTGFAIGGVPPVGHARPIPCFVDEDLLQYPEIWAAAGTPHAVFRLAPEDLLRISQGTVVRIAAPRPTST
jgi:prolyl-tRNA editing enzyme YbaK/EbsC (Cys-tRNA(Pro) deacylase)